MPKATPIQRVVVIGASSGGIQAICTLVNRLPRDFPYPVFVVVHIGAIHSVLPEILNRCGPLRGIHPKDGEAIRAGQIYVAPPNKHLVINDGHVGLLQGPRENRVRPAIDPLFRSAARSYRERAVGIVLSGELDDGTAGLYAIKARGGITIVQDPYEALAASMPRSALEKVSVDHRLRVAEIASLLIKLSRERRRMSPKKRQNGRTSKKSKSPVSSTEGANGTQVPMACPDCNGPLFEFKEGKLTRFHCIVGHAFSPQSLSAAHADALERALWIAIRTLKERLCVQRVLLAKHGQSKGSSHSRVRDEIESIERDIKLLEEIHERI